MISLSSIEADAAGHVVFQEDGDSNFIDSSRRVSRTKTLDGGCLIVDGGFTDADRTFTVTTKYDPDVFGIIRHLHEDRTLIHISANSSFYSGVISTLTLKQSTREKIAISILIKEKLI